jgi:hypothetical protein
MKKSSFFIMMMLAIPLAMTAQCDSCKLKLYYSWYRLNSNKEILSDVFTYEFADSSVTVVAKNKYTAGITPDVIDLHIIPAQDINQMSFRKKGKPGIGVLVGGITGALAGAIVGFARGDSYVYYMESESYVPAGVKAFWIGLAWAGLGVGLGAAIGSSKTKIPVNGDIENYLQNKPRALKYSIRYYTH